MDLFGRALRAFLRQRMVDVVMVSGRHSTREPLYIDPVIDTEEAERYSFALSI